VADQGRKFEAELARRAQEQGDVGVVAGVEDHVRLTALELGDERGQIRGRGRVAFVDNHLEAGLGRPFGGALGDVGAIGSVLVDDGDFREAAAASSAGAVVAAATAAVLAAVARLTPVSARF
jgi:hypothetical protein